MNAVWRTRLAVLVGLVVTAVVLVAAAAPPAPAASGPGHDAGPAPVAATRPAEDRASALVEAEDRRLLGVLRAMPYLTRPYVDRAHGTPTLVLPPARTPYDLAALVALGAAARTGPVVELTTSVLVAPGAALRLDAPDTELRLASGPGGFVSIVAWDAGLTVAGSPGRPVRVVSHDAPAGGPDQDPEDGRAYVRAVGGRADVADAELVGLGFRSGRTGGLAVTGHTDQPASATVTATTVRGGAYGLFVTQARGVVVTDSAFTGHHDDGLRLDRDTRDVVVSHTTAAGNGGSGVVADRGSAAVTLDDVDASGNAGWGVAVVASPLADHPGASGRPTTGTAGFRLRSVRATADRRGGIQLRGVTDAQVSGCVTTAVPTGISVQGGARDVDVAGCTMAGPGRAGLTVRDGGAGVRVHDNRIGEFRLGVQVRDTPVEVTANEVTGATLHGVSLIGSVAGATVTRNVVAGTGPSALDLRRATAPVTLLDNRVPSWDEDLAWWQRLGRLVADHAMLGVWFLAVLIPLLVGRAVRRRERRAVPAFAPVRSRSDLAPAVERRTPGTRVTVLSSS